MALVGFIHMFCLEKIRLGGKPATMKKGFKDVFRKGETLLKAPNFPNWTAGAVLFLYLVTTCFYRYNITVC